MALVCTKIELKTLVDSYTKTNQTIGFVPTMGALHLGHISLIKQAFAENDIVIVSIFVNPTQFDNPEDLENYPKTLQDDLDLILTVSKNIDVFAPNPKEIYGASINAKKYSFGGLEFEMEGKHRSGHFDGVGTIVEALLQLTQATKAYFGEKDFQQLQIVKHLATQLHLPVEIIGSPIYREDSGLAMSSRNKRLSTAAKDQAAFIYKTLTKAKERFKKHSANSVRKWVKKEFSKQKNLQLEYVEIAAAHNLKPTIRKTKNTQYRIFIAAFIENVRLIDNIALN